MRFPRALAPFILASACAAQRPGTVRVDIDTTAHFQTITAWEATAQAGHESASWPRFGDSLIARALDELGLTRLRVEVRSGSENARDYWAEGRAGRLAGDAYRCGRYETVNDNDDPRVIDPRGFHFSELDTTMSRLVLPMRRAAEARGGRLAISVNYVSFFRQCPAGRRYDHRDPEEYAEFALATVLHLRDTWGIVPDFWEPILEPDNTDDWSGERIGRAIVLTAARFREHGLAIRFIAPSTTSMSRALHDWDDLAAVPGARAEIAELSYHRYKGVSYDALRAIADRARRSGVQTAMLEHIGSGVDDLIDDLTIGQVSSWQQYALAYTETADRGGLYFLVDARDAAHPVVRPSSRTRFLAQVFRYVRPGAVRIGASSRDGSAKTVAFRDAGGGLAIAVRTSGAAAVTLTGLPAGRFASTWATEDSINASPADATVGPDGLLTVSIPAAGVLSVFNR